MYVVCPLNVDRGWLLIFETREILITSSYRVVKVISFTYLPAGPVTSHKRNLTFKYVVPTNENNRMESKMWIYAYIYAYIYMHIYMYIWYMYVCNVM